MLVKAFRETRKQLVAKQECNGRLGGQMCLMVAMLDGVRKVSSL